MHTDLWFYRKAILGGWVRLTGISLLVKALREERGWSQSQLARKLDVQHTTVRDWENGKSRPRADNRRALEGLFRLSEGALDAKEDYMKGMTDTVTRMRRLLDHMETGAFAELEEEGGEVEGPEPSEDTPGETGRPPLHEEDVQPPPGETRERAAGDDEA